MTKWISGRRFCEEGKGSGHVLSSGEGEDRRCGHAVCPCSHSSAFQTPQRISPCTICHSIKRRKTYSDTKFYFLFAASIASPFLQAMILILCALTISFDSILN